MSDLFVVSSSPHIRAKENVSTIMRDVVIALLPATAFGIYNFGFLALQTIILCVVSAVGFEALYQWFTKQKVTIGDYSAIITGLLLGLNLPHTVPFWIPILGSAFAIIIVKQLFGGLGQNFMNPALGARAFLLISFAGIMTNWQIDGVTTATPLAIFKAESAVGFTSPQLIDLFIGGIGGSIGETSAIALILGGLYLLFRKVIDWRIPGTYLLSVAVMAVAIGGNGFDMSTILYHVFSGGLLLGAFFMATDYASSPVSNIGKIIMGVGCGILTVLIRLYGGYPEGVSFAIIIMNLFVPLIDRYTIPKSFGEVAK
ncbi:MAG: Na+-transporting NADH:ubiquinone oxidoreductase subunit D [Firmicutes bacterium HGW-Firmicutes-7]|nr:MAG: Na+-transporting NADH:ubiquinone oxidoreductase subunit D [Firmicutes bacterium HGW-Firmicutes-7]